MRLLIVDDSVVKAQIIQKILNNNLSIDTEIVSSAEECLDKLQINSSKPFMEYNLVLMDINLPGMNGIKVTKKIRSHEKYKDLPILMITSANDDSFIDMAFNAGASDYINTTPIRQTELIARVNAALRLGSEMERRKKREEELLETTRILNMTNRFLEKISSHDPLTNIYNRRYFDQFMESEWNNIPKNKQALSLLMIDIDFFKSYNDEYGHQAGDTALKKFSNMLIELVTRTRDVVSRYGGEEFAIILPQTDTRGANFIADEICKKIYSMKLLHKHSPFENCLTCSIGVATELPENWKKNNMNELILKADKALYKAKEKGRNQAVVYQET
ncbi:MAG: diguanylate cyclase [Leptospira sp.]|nr:diguanylate cyclase [Leptospira sp.]NCS93254.1 diguanylate cyclase [Leptospira sp.]